MTRFTKGRGRAAAGALLALGAGLFDPTVLAEGANAGAGRTSQVVPAGQAPASYHRHIKTMEDNMGQSISSSAKGGLGSKGSFGAKYQYAERSFSSAAYRENTTSELRRMHEQAFGKQSETNAPSTNPKIQEP